jgi:hypothetical protein
MQASNPEEVDIYAFQPTQQDELEEFTLMQQENSASKRNHPSSRQQGLRNSS